MSYLLVLVVTLATWMTPMRGHRSGTFVTYGGQALVEANAEFHGYDISWSPTRCGIATVSPTMLGQIIWIRPAGGEWVMCYGVDVVQRRHWQDYVIRYGFIGDVPRTLMESWGSPQGMHGVDGEMFMGVCPPGESSYATRFRPNYRLDVHEPLKAYSGWPYPPQQPPVRCD